MTRCVRKLGRMRTVALLGLLVFGLLVAGCGWSPPSAPPPQPDTCAEADGPNAATVSSAIAALAPARGGAWKEVGRGHTGNCRLNWVQVSGGTAPDAPQQLLMFDRNTALGTATPQPRPYTTVLNSFEKDTVTVQYQWQQPGDQPNAPTGISQVRFQLGEDGKLKALDPLPPS